MLNQARKLMESALCIVSSENDVVWVDYANKRFSLVRDANLPHVYASFPGEQPYVKGLLTYLHENGYITYQMDENHFYLTYKAFYYDEFHKEERLDFLKNQFIFLLSLPLLVTLLLSFLRRQRHLYGKRYCNGYNNRTYRFKRSLPYSK